MPYPRKDVIQWMSGCYYHLYNRGARQATIFLEEENYLYVLERMKRYCVQFDLTVIAYCLMPNHYHFLVRQNGEHPAGLLSQRIFNSYTKAYNKRYGRSGTLFQGRYEAKLVDTDAYLRHLCRYIHVNPVKDSIVNYIGAWPYSNYLDWVGRRKGELIDRDFVIDYFGGPVQYEREMVQFIRDRGYLGAEYADLDFKW